MGHFLGEASLIAGVVGIVALNMITARYVNRKAAERSARPGLDLRSPVSRAAVGLLCVVMAGVVGFTSVIAYSGGSAAPATAEAVAVVFMLVIAVAVVTRFFIRWPGRRS